MRRLSKREGVAGVRDHSVKRSEILVAGWNGENKRRVTNAERALRFYLKGEHDPATVVRNLLSDLRHYCDAYNVNFAEQDGVACRNYAGQALELI
jgi:hypothetical protein